MDAARLSYLAGNELPDPAHVKTLLVAAAEQGIPAKLHEQGKATTHACTCFSKLHMHLQ